jgi:pimeloyl-ACP methyl ester carboxylesterase
MNYIKDIIKNKKMKTAILSTLLVLSVLFSTGASANNHESGKAKQSKTFVLVHGAWLAPYVWDKVAKDLTKKGNKVVLVELPGHGDDKTAPSTLTLDVYRDKVITALDKIQGKVILVGHSMAGMVISEVAEAAPDKIEKLIYIGAYVPADGQSLLSLASVDAKALLGPSLIPSADKLTLDVKKENIINIFCADSSPETQALLMKNYRAEPAIPFTNPAKLTDANFGKTSKAYIHTIQDHAVGIDLQNQMVSAAKITDVYSLESSHTPFLSMPDKVTALLLKITQQ